MPKRGKSFLGRHQSIASIRGDLAKVGMSAKNPGVGSGQPRDADRIVSFDAGDKSCNFQGQLTIGDVSCLRTIRRNDRDVSIDDIEVNDIRTKTCQLRNLLTWHQFCV